MAEGVHAFRTTDPEEAHGWLRAAYADHSVTPRADENRFRFSSARTPLDAIALSSFRYSGGAQLSVPPDRTNLLAFRVTSGTYEVVRSGQTLRVGRGGTALLPSRGQLRISWSDVDITVVTLETARVREAVAEVTGQEPGAVTFELGQPPSAAAERRWWQTVGYVDQVLRRSSLGAGPLLRGEASRLLTVAALETFPNTATTPRPVRESSPSRPWVDRAVAYIEEHADSDVRLADIAATARVSPRALQAGFRDEVGATPLNYLRGVRLELAHRDLETGSTDAGDSVSAIADRWGFLHHGRFAATYRQRYGRSPRETLTR